MLIYARSARPKPAKELNGWREIWLVGEREREGGREEGGRGRDFQVPNLEFSLEAKRKSLLETPSLLLRGRRGTQHVHVYPVPSWKKLDGSPLPAWHGLYILYTFVWVGFSPAWYWGTILDLDLRKEEASSSNYHSRRLAGHGCTAAGCCAQLACWIR